MWFKNLRFYRLLSDPALSPEQLDKKMDEHRHRPCGSLEPATFGWVSPLGRHGRMLTHAVDGRVMVCVRKEEKILPPSLVREKLGERVAELEDAEHRRVGRKEQERLKEELMHDLLPKALTRSNLTYAYIDARGGWIVVDAASAKRAEELLSLLRNSIGSLRVRPVAVNQPPEAVMTGWLAGEGVPEGLEVGGECELRDPSDDAVVRCRHQNLFGEEIEIHLQAGKRVAKLALEWREQISFVLDTDLVLRRVRFDDELQGESVDASEDELSRFDTDLSLMGRELDRLLAELLEAFGGLNEDQQSLREAV
jgi:recombination associated protein RdgC